MAEASAFSIDRAWNAVALEERLELVNRAHATGILAGAMSLLLMGTIGYGFDQIWLLLAGLGVSFFITPMFTSYSWRRYKPQLILAYLAVRTVARRYAYGCNIVDLDTVLIFRGFMEQRFANATEEALFRQEQGVDIDESSPQEKKSVWIALLRGGVVLLSERPGGAKLEFASAITAEFVCKKIEPKDDRESVEILLTGATGQSRGRTVAISSKYPAALYVFEKHLSRLVLEAFETQQKLKNLRTQEFEAQEGAPKLLGNRFED